MINKVDLTMKSLVLLSLFSLAFGAPDLLGTKECTYGPSYWCSQLSRAQKCGAVKHCTDTVWKQQNIKEGNDTIVCDICIHAVGRIQDLIKKNGTKEEIEDMAKKICDLLTVASEKQECDNLVTNELPMILNIMQSMGSKQICCLLKVCTCPGFEDRVHHREISQPQDIKVNTDKVCTDCHNFFTDIQNMIVSNETQDQIIQLLKQTICSQLGPIQGICEFVADEYVPVVLQYLGQSVDPQVTCTILGFCNNNGDLYKALKTRIQFKHVLKKFYQESFGGSEECDLCKSVVQDVQSLDRDVTTQGKIKEFIKTELCGKLGELKDQCNAAVEAYAPIIFQLLANELDPVTVCTSMGFCRKMNTKIQSKTTQALQVLPVMPVMKSKPVEKITGIGCTACTAVISLAKMELKKNATEKEVEAALDAICKKLPGSLPSECEAFVSQYAPAIISLLNQDLNASEICKQIGLCTSSSSPQKVTNSKKVKASVECIICEFALDKLESILSENATQKQVEAALDKVCSLLPTSISDECVVFVDTYGQTIIQLLISKVPPRQVCTTLGLCSGVTRTVPKTPTVVGINSILLRGAPININKKPVSSGELCIACEMVFNYVAEALKEKDIDKEINMLLRKACTLLPSNISEECQGLCIAFEGEIDEIIQELSANINPKEICQAVGVCSAKKVTAPQALEKIKSVLLSRQQLQDKRLYFKPRNNRMRTSVKTMFGNK